MSPPAVARPGSPRGPGDAFPTAPPTSQREHVGGASRPAPRPCYTVLAELGVLIPGGRRGRGNSKHSRSGSFRQRPRRYSVSTSGAHRVRPPTPHPDRRSAPADALARPPPSPHPSRTTPTRPHRATRDAAPATTAGGCRGWSACASTARARRRRRRGGRRGGSDATTSGSARTSSGGLSQRRRAASRSRAAAAMASRCDRCSAVSADSGVSSGQGEGERLERRRRGIARVVADAVA